MYSVIFIHPHVCLLGASWLTMQCGLGIITLEDLLINTISMIRKKQHQQQKHEIISTAILYSSSMIIFSHICLFNENKE